MIPRRSSPRTRAAARALPWVLIAALLPSAHACRTSPEPRRAAVDDSPRGASVVVHLADGRRLAGELLAVRDSSLLLLLPGNRVAVGHVADVDRVDLGTFGWSRQLDRNALTSPGGQERARQASRFPYGLPDPALRAVLARFGQASPDTLRAGAR